MWCKSPYERPMYHTNTSIVGEIIVLDGPLKNELRQQHETSFLSESEEMSRCRHSD